MLIKLKSYRKTAIVAGVLALGMMVFIFVMSHMPGTQSANLSGFFARIIETLIPPLKEMQGAEKEGALAIIGWLVRKAAHFTEFGILAGLVSATIHTRYDDIKKDVLKGFVVAVAFVAVYAISDEVHQYFVAGRVGAVEDVLIDTLGGLAGAALVALFHRAHPKAREICKIDGKTSKNI
jgi:VanZ family protein